MTHASTTTPRAGGHTATRSMPARIGIVRLSALGDVVLASAILDALTATRPAAPTRVAWITREPYAALFRHDPRIDHLIVYDPDNPAAARDSLATFDPDSLVDLQVNLRSDRLIRGFDVTRRARIEKSTLRRRLAVVGVRSLRARPVVERYLDALSVVTGREERGRPQLHVPAGEGERVRAHLPDAELIVGMNPGSRWQNKAWPAPRYAALARTIAERPGHGVAVFLGPDEAGLEATFRGLGERVRCVQRPLSELPALFSHLAVTITGDSGPLHVSEAVGTPVVAMYGPTTDHFGFRPFREDSFVIEQRRWCRPCHIHGGHRCPLGHHRCMLDITVDEVLEAVDRAIGDPAHGA